ncbi:hypothetical protein ACWGBV_03120 [Streptomyces sp. NPDC055051]
MTTAPERPKRRGRSRGPWSLGTFVVVVLLAWALSVTLGIAGVFE